jgi:hypothetical protein
MRAVTCEVPGFRTASREIELSAAEPVHRETFVLEPLWQIAVRLVSPDGQSLLRAIPREDLDLWACLDLAATKEAPGARIEARRDGLVVRSSAGSWLGSRRSRRPVARRAADGLRRPDDGARGAARALERRGAGRRSRDAAGRHLRPRRCRWRSPSTALIGLYGSVQCRVVDARTGAPVRAGLGAAHWIDSRAGRTPTAARALREDSCPDVSS